jgi:hypothetical protein
VTSSPERPELVNVLIIRQELDFVFRKPEAWDQWPEEVQTSTLDAVLRHGLRQVLDPGIALSARGPGMWFLGPDEPTSRNGPAFGPVLVAGGYVSVKTDTDWEDFGPTSRTSS